MDLLQSKQKKEEQAHQKTIAYIKLLYKIKNSIKINSFILYFAFIFKFLGLVLISHIFDSNKNNLELDTLIRKITSCYNSDISCINRINYPVVCVLIYVILFIPYVLFLFALKIEHNLNPKVIHIQKKILLAVSVFNLFTLFLSQHVIEILSYIIYSFVFKNAETDIFLDKLGIFKYLLLVINIIIVIYLNVGTFYYIVLLNVPFFSQVHTIQIYQNKWFKIFLVLLTNSQAVSLLPIFTENDKDQYKLFIVFVVIFVLLCEFIAYYRSFFSEQTFLSKIFIYSHCMCFISSLIEIFFYYATIPEPIKTSEFIQKIFIEFIFAYIIIQTIHFIRKKRFKEFEKMFFTKQKKISVEPYIYITTILLESVKDNRKLELILSLIHIHKENCKDPQCFCHKSTYQLKYQNIEHVIIQNKTHLSLEQFYILYKDIIIIIENEIYNMLIQISKINRLVDYCQIILLHVEYLCYFSMNIPFGTYLIEKYLKKIGNDIPFMLKFQLYQLKRYFISEYKKKLVLQSLGLNQQIRKDKEKRINTAKELISFWKFFKYQKVVNSIYSRIENCVNDFLTILSLGQIKKNAMILFKVNSSSTQDNYLKSKLSFQNIIKMCKDFQESHHKLVEQILVNFSKDNKLVNAKVCYLLSMYYYTIMKKMPDEISDLFHKNRHLDHFISENSQSFTEKGFNHPLIVTLQENKNFEIIYACKYLNTSLGFEPNELIGKDINILLPKQLWAPHQIAMRNQVLKRKDKFLEREKFIIDKKGYHIPVRLTIGSFPTLSKNIIVIINVKEHTYPKNYSFLILDEFGNFLTYSKEIESKFVINREIIKKNKFNFFNYFNLNENIFDPFKKSVAEIEKGEKQLKSIHINRSSLKQLGEQGKINAKIKNVKELTFIYDKNRLKASIDKIKNWLNESQTDFNLLRKIKAQEKMFDSYQNTNNYRSNLQLLNVFKQQLLGFKIKVSSCDLTTFYYVSIFEVEYEHASSIQNVNFISSSNFSSYKCDEAKKNLELQNALTPPMYSKPMKNFPHSSMGKEQSHLTFTSLNTLNRWSLCKGKQSKNSSLNLNQGTAGFGIGLTKNTNSNLLNVESSVVNPHKNIKQTKIIVKKITTTNDGNTIQYQEMEMIIKRIHSKNNNSYASFYFIFFLLIVFLLISIVFYPFSIDMINKAKNFFMLSLSLKSLQYEISLSSSLIFDGCSLNTFLPNTFNYSSKSKHNDQLIFKANQLLARLNLFTQQLNNINSDKIIQAFNKETFFTVIKPGLNEYNKTSTFSEEMLYLHYYLEYLGRNQGTSNCDLNHFLYGDITYSKEDELTYSEMIFYFVTKNLLSSITIIISNTYSLISQEIKEHFNNTTVLHCLYISLYIIVFAGLCIFFYFIFKKLVLSNIRLVDLIISEKKDSVIVYRLTSIKNLIEDFSYQKCEAYQQHLNDKGRFNIIVTKETDYDNDMLSKSRRKTQIKKSNSNINTSSSNILSTSNDFLNTSSGNLKKISSKKTLKKRITQHHKEEKITKESEKEEEKEICTEINYHNYLRKNLKLIHLFFILLFFFIIATVILLSVYIFLNIREITLTKKYISLGITYINNLSLHLLLSLVYKTTILYFDPYLGKSYTDEMYRKELTDNWYDIEINKNSSVYNNLNDTLYPLIYYMLSINEINIEKFYSQTGYHGTYGNLKILLDTFNSEFCVSSSYEYQKRFSHFFSVSSFEDFISEMNDKVKECKLIGEGLITEGLSSAKNAIINEMNTKYMEFIKNYKNSSRDKVVEYLKEGNINKFSLMYDYPFDRAEMVIINEVSNELSNNFKGWRSIETLFIVLFIIFDILFVFSGYVITNKLSFFYMTLHDVANRIKDALGSD